VHGRTYNEAKNKNSGEGRAMLTFPSAIKIRLAVGPVDMRKHFNGLWAEAQRLGEQPRDGALLLFTNSERTRLKLLYWDGTGVNIVSKRLEKGRFSWPRPCADRQILDLAPEAFALLVNGVELKDAHRKAWYER
jgi:transposase